MRVMPQALAAIIKKPFLAAYMAAVMLLLCILSRLNPLLPVLSGYERAADADLFEQIISLLQFFLQKDILPYAILGTAVFSLAGGLAAALFFSGYFNVLGNAVRGVSKTVAKDFAKGFKQLFLRMFIASAAVLFVLCFFVLFMLVSSVPLMLIMRDITIERPNVLAVSVLVAVLTAAVLFLGSMYFRIYALFYLPAVAARAEKPFRAGKKAVDRYFWKTVFAFFIFDVAMISAQFLFTYFDDSIYLFTAKWVFYSVYAILLSTYVFSAYTLYSRRRR